MTIGQDVDDVGSEVWNPPGEKSEGTSFCRSRFPDGKWVPSSLSEIRSFRFVEFLKMLFNGPPTVATSRQP